MLPDMTMLKEIGISRARPGREPLREDAAQALEQDRGEGLAHDAQGGGHPPPHGARPQAEGPQDLRRARRLPARTCGPARRRRRCSTATRPRGGGVAEFGGEPYAAFVKAYFNFVMLRLKCFTGRFDEPKAAVQAGAAAAAAAGSGAATQTPRRRPGRAATRSRRCWPTCGRQELGLAVDRCCPSRVVAARPRQGRRRRPRSSTPSTPKWRRPSRSRTSSFATASTW